MKERPILFNGAMVRAILDGNKTQTRRPMKVQPPGSDWQLARVMSSTERSQCDRLHWVVVDKSRPPGLGIIDSDNRYFDCPYGVPGDRLWVKETWAPYKGSLMAVADLDDADAARYAADEVIHLARGNDGCMAEGLDMYAMPPHREMPGGPHRWRPSIHMPRWASRITLEVTDVRVQRVQDITPEDAIAEGCFGEGRYAVREGVPYPVATFAALWESAYGADSWARNPWVWAISFRRIDAKGGAL